MWLGYTQLVLRHSLGLMSVSSVRVRCWNSFNSQSDLHVRSFVLPFVALVAPSYRQGRLSVGLSRRTYNTGFLSFLPSITCSYYPLEISLESFAEVLFHSQLSEGLPSLNAGPLVTELSANKHTYALIGTYVCAWWLGKDGWRPSRKRPIGSILIRGRPVDRPNDWLGRESQLLAGPRASRFLLRGRMRNLISVGDSTSD